MEARKSLLVDMSVVMESEEGREERYQELSPCRECYSGIQSKYYGQAGH